MFGIDFLVTISFLATTAPIWFTFMLCAGFYMTWLNYKRRQFINKQGSVLLEIRLPKEITKTPAAMEMVFEGMWEDVPGSTNEVFFEGAVRNWYSLEIVSVGGEVKFYIWTWPKWRQIVENRLYAQFPGIEIHEAEDYALDVIYDPDRFKIGGLLSTRLVKEDVIPIKTYIDFGLDKTGNEPEEIIDPLVPVLEFLGSRKPGEIAAVQILIQSHRHLDKRDTLFNPKDHFAKGVKAAVEKIAKEAPYFKSKNKDDPPSILNLTKTQTDAIASIERNAGKHAYDTMIKLLYFAPKETADKMAGTGLIGAMRQFAFVGPNTVLNGIRPGEFLGYEYAWSDPFGWRAKENQRRLVDSFKRRSFFNVPHKNMPEKPYVLSIEELATIFHFPAGATATTPTLNRIPSKKAEAPANLPI